MTNRTINEIEITAENLANADNFAIQNAANVTKKCSAQIVQEKILADNRATQNTYTQLQKYDQATSESIAADYDLVTLKHVQDMIADDTINQIAVTAENLADTDNFAIESSANVTKKCSAQIVQDKILAKNLATVNTYTQLQKYDQATSEAISADYDLVTQKHVQDMIGAAATDYWAISGNTLSPKIAGNDVKTSGIFKISKSTAADCFFESENLYTSTRIKNRFGTSAAGNFVLKIVTDPEGAATTTTPFIIAKQATNYALSIETGNALLVNTSFTDGNHILEITGGATARKIKFTDSVTSKNIVASIEQSYSPWGGNSFVFDIGQASGVGGFAVGYGAEKLFHINTDGSIVSNSNSYHGFNGYYNSGWKVSEGTKSAFIIKHYDNENRYSNFISTTTDANDILTESERGVMGRIDANNRFYFTKTVYGAISPVITTGIITPNSVYTTGIPSFIGVIRAYESLTSYSKAQIESKFTILSTSIGGTYIEGPFTITKDTAASVNIYFDGGVLCVQNKLATNVSVYLSIILTALGT